MDLGSPETWRWIWMAAAVGFVVGELSMAGTFFLAPFAVGAFVATVAAFAGVSVAVEWLLFLVTSAASFAALRPLARRLDARTPMSHVGANRWVSREALVLEEIGPGTGATGLVRLDREHWRAESLTGDPIPAGTPVLVMRVDGTRMVVVPSGEPPVALPPSQGAP